MDNFGAILKVGSKTAIVSVSQELAKLRVKYGWSQEEAASLAGVAPTTWYRAERADNKVDWSKGLRRRTLRTMLESLLNCPMPINAADAFVISDKAGIPRTAIRIPLTRAAPVAEEQPPDLGLISHAAAVRLVSLIFQFAARVGADRAEAVLRQITEIPVATPLPPPTSDPRAAAAKAYLRVSDPPRQRPDGSIEQVSRGYESAATQHPPARPIKRTS